jgi:capsular polysaccharide transport system ATP-binding protein
MIILEGVTKVAGDGEKKRNILTTARLMLPPDHRIAVLGPSAEDKRIFINLLAGVALPTSGRIIRQSRVSFPPGNLAGFTRTLTVRVNVAHVARLYGADVDAVVDFVAKASGLGEDFNKLFGDLANTKRRHLSDILAFSIPFDVYLLSDDVVRKGGSRYNKEASALFEARAKTSGMIIASQDDGFAREYCNMGLILADGRARLFNNLERAISSAGEAAKNPSAQKRQEGKKERQKEKRKAKRKQARKTASE